MLWGRGIVLWGRGGGGRDHVVGEREGGGGQDEDKRGKGCYS